MTSKEAKQCLLDFLRENRIEQKEFAKMIGKSEVTISRWLNSDKELSESNINAIKFIIWSYSSKKHNKVSRPSEISFNVPPAQFAPLLTIAQAASIQPTALGLPIIEDGETSGFINVQEGDFAVVIAGRSMMPWYPPGTHVLVRRSEVPKNGDRVVAMLADSPEPVFKVFIDKGDHFTLLSINEEDGLPPIHLNKMDREEWYWCYPIVESKRNERALDAAMRELDLPPFWQRKSVK